jgi:hypothetical protein
MLGTSGSACDRSLLVTASARSLPSLICGTAGGRLFGRSRYVPFLGDRNEKPKMPKVHCHI